MNAPHRFRRLLRSTLVLAAGSALLIGCSTGSRAVKQAATVAPSTSSTTAAPTTSGTTTAPVATQAPTTTQPQVTWDAFFQATPAVQNDSVYALHLMPGGMLLTGSATGQVQLLDLTNPATRVSEGSFGSISSFAEHDGRVFMGTSEPFFMGGNLGQVYVRDAQGNWTMTLDHPAEGITIAADADTLYAFASGFNTGNPDATVSTLAKGNAAVWQQDVATFTGCQINKAVLWRNEVWAAGSENSTVSGGLRIFHGKGATFTEVTTPPTARGGNNQLEITADLEAINGELYLASAVIDTLTGNVLGGCLYKTSDATTWTKIKVYQQDCPLSVALHEGTIFVGLVSGGLEVQDAVTGTLTAETTIPANTGVMALLEASTDVLLAGIRGTAGAELYTRTTTQVASTTTSPTTAPAPTYASIKPVLQAKCTVCHANSTNPAFTAFGLTLTNDATDYAETVKRVNLTLPDASLLLEKAINKQAHGGGATLTSGSPEYNTLLQWIAAGAKQ
ncbi:MAG: hypothetical protein AB7N76_25965 [Planctomycetota bacterium]